MQKKSNKLSFALVLIVIVISTMFSIYSISHIGKENEKDMNLLLTASIHDAIDNSLSKPIMAAKTMSYTEPLIRFLDKEESLGNAEADIELMKAYLTDLKKGLKYDSVFVVSEGTRRYYTDHGLNKIVDPENDAHDIWYSFFLDKNKYYDLDVDTDEVNYNTWTVFVNTRVVKDGKLLGVCGVGVKMPELQDILIRYEKQYGVKINLVDGNGLVQVDTDEINIESAYLDEKLLSEKSMSEYVYNELDDGRFSVTKYVDNLGWYLVVQSSGNNINDSLIRTITLNAILFLIVVLVFVGFNHSNRRRTKLLLHSSYHDQLTGLKNRRAYEETIAGLSMEKMKNDFVFIIADINGLKKSNDNIGHLAGDEMIMGAADCLRMAFGENADIFRIGGDEFAVILRTDEKQLKKYLASLKKHSNAWRGEIVEGLSMSVGYIAQWDNQDKTLHEMINEADKKMYDDKKAFYSNLENE